MHNKKITLIASDIDGTLLDSRNCLSERTKNALLYAHKKGIHTVIATGRSFTALPDALLHIDSLEYVITSNGTSIFRLSDGKRIYAADMDEAKVSKVYNIFKKYSYPIEVFVEGQAYATMAYCLKPSDYGNISEDYVRRTRIPVEDMENFIHKHKHHIEGMDMVINDAYKKAQIRSEIESLEDIYVTSSVDHYIEIASGGCSKAAALKQLTQMLDINLSDVIAFGDAENDLEMICETGIGVAMENGSDVLKQSADMIAPSNDDDGVAAVLEMIFNK